jgi:ribosome-binding factor A
MSNRLEKVNSLLQKEISKIIAKDFNFHGTLVTVTHVDATGNLIEAKAYISVLPDEKTDQVIKLLNKEVYGIQQKINKKLNMRPIPKIKFVEDKVIAEAANIEKLLESLK